MKRYEHIDLDLSTAGCDALLSMLTSDYALYVHEHVAASVRAELANLENELRARLQRRDVDIQCPKNAVMAEDWLDA